MILTCVSRGLETVCSVFMSVSVCALCSIFNGCHTWMWFQGMWKHVSFVTNVITIACCLMVLSISFITAFIADAFMWFGQIGFAKLQISTKSVNIHLLMWNLAWLMGNGSCSGSAAADWYLGFFVHHERRMSEHVCQFLFSLRRSKSHDHTSSNSIYKPKLEICFFTFWYISQTHFYS